jgi:Raf kinase inhibitor-like YbhB/YbcL family protein
LNNRYILVLCLGTMLLFACSLPALATPEPVEPSPVEQVPAQPTDPPTPTELPPTPTTEVRMPFELTSSAFKQGEPIPAKYSCNGEDISPPLAWGDPPEGTQSLTLIMDDPDAPAGTWVHWIVFNLPMDVRTLPENMPAGMKFGDVAATFGVNSWGRNEYGGPCPPSGTHRYFFKLYALDTTLSLDANVKKGTVQNAMEGHVLAETELMGIFSR